MTNDDDAQHQWTASYIPPLSLLEHSFTLSLLYNTYVGLAIHP